MKRSPNHAAADAADQPPGGRVAEDIDPADVETVGKMTEALEIVEQARGLLHGFHRLTGAADLALDEVVERLHSSGHHKLAEQIETDLIGRNVIEGRWTYQIIDEYDETYYAAFRDSESAVRDELADGHRHLAEAQMKQRRRTPGHPRHQARPTGQ